MRRPVPHRVVRAPRAFFALAIAGVLSSPALAQFRWCESLGVARKRAAEQKAPIFIALHARGHRASALCVDSHYKNKSITRLAKSCVPVFASDSDDKVVSGVKAAVHKNCLFEVRDALFDDESKQSWLGPWHAFLSADGKLLFAVPGQVTAAELEWCLARALRSVAQDAGSKASVKLSDAAHAPRAVRFGDDKLSAPTGATPPTDKEIEEILAEMGKGGRAAWRNARESLPRLVFSEHPKALELGGTALRFSRGQRRAQFLDGVGRNAPIAWAPLVEKQLSNRDEGVRLSALRALGRMLALKSAGAVSKRLRDKDESEKVHTRALHTSARLQPRDRSVVRAIDKLLRPGKRRADTPTRAWAMRCAAQLELRKDVVRILSLGLADSAALVRRASAHAIAWRREEAMRGQLDFALEGEKDEVTKSLLEAAKKALDAGSLEAFTPLVDELEKALEYERPEGEEERGGRRGGGGRRGIGG